MAIASVYVDFTPHPRRTQATGYAGNVQGVPKECVRLVGMPSQATGDFDPRITKDAQDRWDLTGSETTLSDALLTLRKRKWIVVVAALLGLAYGLYKAQTQPHLYEAYARVQVRSGSSNEFRVSPTGAADDPLLRMQNEIVILESDTLLLTVAREMNLPNNPDFLETGVKGPALSLEAPSVRQETLSRLSGRLSIALVPKTEIMRISYRSLDPKFAAAIVNKIVGDYIQRSFETRYASTQRASQWLSSQLGDLKQQVETSQQQVMDLQKRLGVLGFDPKDNQISTSLEDLSRASGAATIARIIAESRYRMLRGTDPGTVDGSIETTPGTAPGEFYALRSQIAMGKANYAQMQETYGPNHPLAKAQADQIAELERQLEAEQVRLLTQARQNFLAAKANEAQTTEVLERQKTEAYKLRDDTVDYMVKARELDANRTLYEGLLSRLRTAGVQAGLESTEIDVVDQALVPAYPILQPRSTLMLTDGVFGLLFGIALAFLLDSLDSGLHDVAEIEGAIQLPSLAIVPQLRRIPAASAARLTLVQRNLAVLWQPKSQFAEAFRALRTSLLLSTAGEPPKLLLFTSATPSEGKTTTACNLACVLAQSESRVLLIDADLRRPSIHHRFGLSGLVGLSTLLAGSTTFEDSLQRVSEIPDLDILVSGPIPPFPYEMLLSAPMAELLERCATIYTHIVIDSPPVLSVTDAVVLSRHMDAVVLVVRHGKSSRNVVRRARDLLIRAGAPLTGLVLNAVDMNSPDYRGFYGKSGYAYSTVDAESWTSPAQTTKRKNPDDQ